MPLRLKDPAHGISAESLHFWRNHRHQLGPITEAQISFPGLGGEPPYHGLLRDARGNEMLLSGVSAGLRGPCSRAAHTILLEAGFDPTDADQVYRTTRLHLMRPARERALPTADVRRDITASRPCPLRFDAPGVFR
jgi:hypothetical protein